MSITKFAIEKDRITWVAIFVTVFAGWGAYQSLPRSEDPGFTIRIAQIVTIFPGASPERVENLVTDKLEAVIQEIPELKFVTSESRSGISLIYVEIQEKYKEMQPIWDNLRRKVDRASAELPADAHRPVVNDEFGDVFGIILTLTGEGFNYVELKDVADQVRDVFLNVSDVAKVDIYGAQEERIFIEYDNTQLAQLQISSSQLQKTLQAQNILFPGGRVTSGTERIILEPSGSFDSIEDLQKTILSLPGQSDVLYLGDIAHVYRGYVDPPISKMRFKGTPSLGIGISMREGGNIINMGDEIREIVATLQTQYPIGIEFDFVAFQPDEANKSTRRFSSNLLQAIVIVVLVMMFTLGLRTGLIVSSLIPVAVLLALAVMKTVGIGMNMISLSALIISLGLLVDNAIVMSELIMVSMQEGMPRKEAAIAAAKELRVPLLTASLTTTAAFMPVALAESASAEYTSVLFYVTGITLLGSWLLSLTMIPLMCVLFVKVKQKSKEETYDSGFYRAYRGTLLALIRHPILSIIGIVLFFIGGIQLGKFVPNIFFPHSDRAFLTATLKLPVGTPIEITEAMMDDLETFMHDSLMINNTRVDGITNWASFIGQGGPRFYLSINPEPQAEELAYMLINATTRLAADAAKEKLERYCLTHFPDLNPLINPLDYGPPVMAPVQIRLSGESEDQLFQIVENVKGKLAETPGTKNISDNWGPRIKKILVNIDQARARRAGVTSMDVAVSLQSILSGIEITQFREDDKVIPITLRATEADRQDLGKLETLDIYSQSTGRTVSLKQVADLKVVWQPSKILRRDRIKTVTVECYNEAGFTAMDIYGVITPWFDQQQANWPVGYKYEFGGELESSVESQRSIMAKMPLAMAVIILLLVVQFNSLRRPTIILLTIPLAFVGINFGLVVTGKSFGFMTLLGMISLIGIVINNAIVLLDRIKIEIEELGLDPHRAVIDAAQKRLRPILLTTATTMGGMMPLWFSGGPLFSSLAVAIIFGLLFATLLTLGVVPILYSLFFRLNFKNFEY
ncbi:efflux RND transporter permease subunit [bacterium]|nr:efflux RND transporter permease subunit [bacterium]MBU1651180.1 efflux RND transporter permease subunit [bacterium]